MKGPGPNLDQQEFWDRQAGPKWVRQAHFMDSLLSPVLDELLARAALKPGAAVLDVGCGSGASSRRAAALVGPEGRVLGADISASLLTHARAEAEGTGQLSFTLCDAQTHPFEPASFDLLISRFGVMFFDDPVAAFANMARALRPGGRILFAAWGEIPQNPYFTLPAAVAREHFGASPPKTDPDLPGPFAFRDAARIENILSAAGLEDIRIDPVPLILTGPGDAATLAPTLSEIGPIERAFSHFEANDADREAVTRKLAEALQPWEVAGNLAIPALVNMTEARVPD
ncbi:MAG: methyltransferase domain-containing protein [Sulfitobacter sp.]|nr:methyltransferase domain-containing protein [Sulfitobacter sp.]